MPTRNYLLEENQRAVIHTLLSAELAKQKKFTPWLSELTDTFANEHRADEPPPVRQHNAMHNDPRFTEQDKQAIFEWFLDEANDMSGKDMAAILMDDADLVDTVQGAVPADMDAEELARMLELIDNSEQDYVNGEFLRNHDDDGDNYVGMLDFAKRMKLTDEDETALTDLGREFVSQLL